MICWNHIMTIKNKKLFEETTKDITNTFKRAFNRGFWSGFAIGFLMNVPLLIFLMIKSLDAK